MSTDGFRFMRFLLAIILAFFNLFAVPLVELDENWLVVIIFSDLFLIGILSCADANWTEK